MGYFCWFGEDKSKHLSHHGIKGQKWGVRRFQNYDGTRIKGGVGKTVLNTKQKKTYYEAVNAETVKNVNPNFGKPGYTQNCASCVLTVDLMSRGYNVTASPHQGTFNEFSFKNYYTNSKVIDHPGSTKDIDKTLKKEGENSSGLVCMYYEGWGSGHVFNWEVHEGNVYYTDGQSASRKKGQDRMFDYYIPFDESYGFYALRLDQAEPNIEKMKQDGLVQFKEDKNGNK